jgi:prefoldin subunit 5
MREFAKQSDDERIKSMMRRIEVLTSKCARWNEAIKELEAENERLEQENSQLLIDYHRLKNELEYEL